MLTAMLLLLMLTAMLLLADEGGIEDDDFAAIPESPLQQPHCMESHE